MDVAEESRRALDTASARGAQYADIRFEHVGSERIEIRNGVVSQLADAGSVGYGIRALVDGAWGFAASSDLSNAGLDAAAARAVAIAKASAAMAREPFGAPPARAYIDRYHTPLQRDPASVPLGERVALLLEAEKLVHTSERIKVGRAWLDLWRTHKHFFSTSGSDIDQTIVQTGSGIAAMAVGESDVQTRTFPGDIGLYKAGGWEIVEEASLLEECRAHRR